jgi:hypothetical protein
MAKVRRDLSWVKPEMLGLQSVIEFRDILPEFKLDGWENPEVRDFNIDLLRRISSIDREIIDNKGGWSFPEKVYLDDPTYLTKAPEHKEELDRFTLRQPMCHSLSSRFVYITKTLLPKYIERALIHSDNVKVASFGSGTGRDIMTTMLNYPNVTVDCYDLDSLALSEGRKISENLGLQGRVKMIHQDLTAINNGYYDIGLVVGVICPLPDTIAKRLLKIIRKNIDPKNGSLIVSSSAEKMEHDDPLSRFLIEYAANWYLQFRDNARMEQIGIKTGYTPLELGHEPMNYHKLAVYEISKK